MTKTSQGQNTAHKEQKWSVKGQCGKKFLLRLHQ